MSTRSKVRLYTIPAVAADLGVSEDTVYRRIRSGALPAVDIGVGRSKMRIREDDLAAFINGLVSVA